MSSIDAVIARARRPGAFSERQRFTLARSRAIQKMRHFALANPHYYVLELIQASVASGASWISMYADDLSFTLSYVGGGFPEAGLSNLFDFLFASKERQELAALRALALGVNALMLFHPRRIVIESGDGTLAGTTRMELESDADRLEIGRPDQALAGTFIRVEGMKRSKMGAELKLPIQGEGLDERGIIEQRCLCAPVPIFFNDEPIFGVASLRIPRTFGYRRSIEIDEGDLFGTLALDPLGGAPSIRLLTCGVWIESIEHELVPGSQIGGTINFDTLHKTADHARVVRDQRLEDMWLRLRPYAEMLRRGETALSRAFDVRIFGGGRIDQTQLRGFLRELGRVVVVHPGVIASSAQASVARRIAAALDAELLSASDDQIERLRVLGGREVSVIAPDLKGDEDLRVYTQAPAEEPPRPWLVSVIDAPPLAAGELARLIRGVDDDGPDEAEKAEEREDKAKPKPAVDLAYTRLELARALGVRGDVSVKVYTPGDASGRGALEVRLHTLGREVLRTSVVSAYPGHVLIAEIPGLAPSHFAAIAGLADATAGALARHAAGALHDASRRALHGLIGAEISPCTPQAHLALAAIHRTTVIRMRRREGGVEVVLSPLEVIDGLDLPVSQQAVEIQKRDVTGAIRSYEGVSGPDGVAYVEGIEYGADSAYEVVVRHKGAPFRSDLFRLHESMGAIAEVRVFATTNDLSRVRSAAQIEVIARENDLAQVAQLYQVFVDGDEAFWPGPGLRISGAEGASGFVVMDRASPILSHAGKAPFAELEEPIPPGEVVDLSIAYLVEHDGTATIRWTPTLPLFEGGVLLPRDLKLTKGSDKPPTPPPQAPEAPYDYYALGAKAVGQPIELVVEGLPVRPRIYKQIGLALGLGILALLGLSLAIRPRSGLRERRLARRAELVAALERVGAGADQEDERGKIIAELDQVVRKLEALGVDKRAGEGAAAAPSAGGGASGPKA
ncbi:MAG: hypothetical protein KC420_02650 [Myxococcales bacterium]|nr:hypothetical protein [Myxococcales bacterium]